MRDSRFMPHCGWLNSRGCSRRHIDPRTPPVAQGAHNTPKGGDDGARPTPIPWPSVPSWLHGWGVQPYDGARVAGCRVPSRRGSHGGDPRAQRKVHAGGRSTVAGPNINLGPRHRGKIVTVIEDTHLRVVHGEEEIAVYPRRNLKPITRFHVSGAGANHKMRQASLDDNPSRMS
jgi:hypothetical protein